MRELLTVWNDRRVEQKMKILEEKIHRWIEWSGVRWRRIRTSGFRPRAISRRRSRGQWSTRQPRLRLDPFAAGGFPRLPLILGGWGIARFR